jgi:hypothetical protein
MSRYCHIQNCSNPAVIYIKNKWYCYEHKPIIFDEREDNRLLTGEEYEDQ